MANTIQTKRCSKCKEIKPVSEFYPAKKTKDKFTAWCKQCFHKRKTSPKGRAEAMKYFRSKKGQIAYAHSRKKYVKTEKYRISCRKHANKYRLNHLDIVKVQHKICTAIRSGKMCPASKYKCTYCENQAVDYHHHNGYEKSHWFDVVPVCKPCHLKIHKIIPS